MVVLGICHLAQAVKGNDVLLKGIEDRGIAEEVKHILEMVLSCQGHFETKKCFLVFFSNTENILSI